MESKIGFMLVALLMIFSVNAYAAGNAVKKDAKETVVFSVSMDCTSCKNKIEKNIAFEKGVTDLKVDFPAQTVSVTFRSDKNSVEGLIKAFKKLGFDATVVNEKK